MSQFKYHTSCDKCGSSDAMAVYDDHRHCFSCGFHEGAHKSNQKEGLPVDITPLPAKEQSSIKDRRINSGSVNHYKVTVDTNPDSQIGHIYPFFDDKGNHVANQIRRKGEKSFYWEGDPKASVLFGRQLFPEGGKAVTITEGAADALAAFQLTGSRYCCVSVKSAQSAKRECVESFEYLNSFEKIVICFDNDEPGQKAAQQVAQLFQPGKVHIFKPRLGKDANDYLILGKEKEFLNEWFRAPAYMPDGLILGTDCDLLNDIIDYKEPESVPFPWAGLNKSTYGLRLSELTLFLADTSVGKTTFMKEIEYRLLQDDELKKRGYGVGFIHLEESKRDTALGLMSIHNNKPYHLPDTEKSREELAKAYDDIVNTKRVVIWDAFGSNEIESVLSKVRHMAALGCRYIVIDHLSIIVSDHNGDERKQLDEISTKLKTLTMNLQICCICVMHINRQGLARGSAGPEQLANNVIRLERDKKEPDVWRRNVTRVSVEKCRLSGRTGLATHVWYNPETGRLEELSRELADQYEAGGSLAGQEFEMFA